MISLNNEPCCICGQTRSLLVQEAAYPEHGYPGGFRLRRCGDCGLLFNSPRLDENELAQLYGRNYYFFRRADARELARIVPMYARTVALVEGQITPKRVLDIGCGRGYLPAVLQKLGWDAHGVEISGDAAAYAKQRFGLNNVSTGTAEQYAASNPEASFPLVTAIDVIEHVPAPDSFMAALASLLEPKGVLIIDTPNAASANIKSQGENWIGFNPFHIYLFTIANLTRLLGKHGLQVERSFSYHNVPADRGARSIPARLRRLAIEAARATRTIGPVARAYFKLKSLSGAHGDVQAHLNNTVQSIQRAGTFDESADSSEELAGSKTGDNIVLLARKT